MVNISHKHSAIANRDQVVVSPFFHESLFRSKLSNQYFLIRDPFNNTYNPAKNILVDKQGPKL